MVLNSLHDDVLARVKEALGQSSHRGYESSRARVVFECVLATVTHRVPLSQVDEAFKMQLNKSDTVKVLVTP